jgi:predicted phage tail protein
MKIINKLRTPGVLSISLAMSFAGIQTPAVADIVGTPALAMQAELQMQRNDVRTFLARDDVRQALLAYGVHPSDINARINNMTESELLQIQHQMDMLPAGSSAVGLVLGVILIFVLLDLLGATNIFPGI